MIRRDKQPGRWPHTRGRFRAARSVTFIRQGSPPFRPGPNDAKTQDCWKPSAGYCARVFTVLLGAVVSHQRAEAWQARDVDV